MALAACPVRCRRRLGIVGLLVLFSLTRGLCSVSAKDVLGKTVSKARRGNLMGSPPASPAR
jgi:hypothetical protein